ncbi:MAG TPA: hypothetical protein VF857_10320, partial [Spirochaetota bacterium]
AQATAYVNIISLFSLYTGAGVSVGYGWFKTGFDASGTLTATSNNPAFATAFPTGTIGTIKATSQTTYNPVRVIPTYILGLELDIPIVKIVAESQVNLRNRKDVSASLGIRLQF